jgi:hypothetical protein
VPVNRVKDDSQTAEKYERAPSETGAPPIWVLELSHLLEVELSVDLQLARAVQ